ncbi:MAG: 16S rRNA (uracil(1498)-N(3))-methyltransferase, partial [Planctomycetota bacterium]|nr:16S rRNA (uracil(1498)-N(3))-methyltransferase [Planctomycetota bacterium]
MAPRFFIAKDLLRVGVVSLPASEAQHAAKVLRLQPGDRLEIGDGEGKIGAARLQAINGGAVTAMVEEIRFYPEPRPRLTLATAIPKGKRWQWLVEKCTELGAARLHPLRFRRSIAQGEGDVGKWRRWALEASKQSRRIYLPRISAPQSFSDFLPAHTGLLFWATPAGAPAADYAGRIQNAEEIAVIIGPEGDLTVEERKTCEIAGALPLSLGQH